MKKFVPYVVIFAVAATVYGAIYHFSGDFGPLAINHFNSYSRQAAHWLEGRLDVDNVSWLEIAVFEGRYFISFPPFPSIVMLPLVAIFGAQTPDHAIALAVAFASLFFAYRLAFLLLQKEAQSAFFALFLVLGTNYLHISLWGGVWYIAQNMAFMLTLAAFYFALTKTRWHTLISLFAMCAAMGCRPFNAVYLPAVLWMIYMREVQTEQNIFLAAKNILLGATPAIALGSFFMWLNYARFGNIFEFGHNFLPEFTADPHGQFYIGRIPENLQSLFFNFNILDTPQFGAFAFWVASPIVACYAVYLLINAVRREPTDTTKIPITWVFPLLILAHIVLFSFHRTLGGHQFGARYTVDVLPAVFLALLFLLKKFSGNNAIKNLAPAIFGFLLNFYGTVDFFRFYF
ncbi:MAG: hypothetical protein FWF80_00295 [Defluviitaleaceae bacterium]|nr:hypothetical protein [Defluviitaleaceae bacterium]